MTRYILETVIDGKASRTTLEALPNSYIVRLYSIDDPVPTLMVEKVLK